MLLDLTLTRRGPATLVFCEDEDVLTLGALIAAEMFGCYLPVLRLTAAAFRTLSGAETAHVDGTTIMAGDLTIPITPPTFAALNLTPADHAMLAGDNGVAVQQAMRIIYAMAANQGASRLTSVTQAHIDGCVYTSPANLTLAENMADMGAQVCLPTTMNAISVDRANWQTQGVPPSFGLLAARLADSYARMDCRPSVTCSPYLLGTDPALGENIAWAECNAVIFANTVLGARTAKHPDFLELCIALTGRAPLAVVYLDAPPQSPPHCRCRPAGRYRRCILATDRLSGRPPRARLYSNLAQAGPTRDDLKALCATSSSTSDAPMLHIEGATPEAAGAVAPVSCSP